MLLSDNEEDGLLSMEKDVFHSNHLAEKEKTRVSIFLQVKSVGHKEQPNGLAIKQLSSDALKVLLYNVQ